MMKTKEKIFIYGASGHAKVVIDIVECQGIYDIAFLVDDSPELKGQKFFGYQVIGARDDLLSMAEQPRLVIVAIGSNSARKTVSAFLINNDFELVSAVHPSAQIGRDATFEAGTVIMAGSVINSGTKIGRSVIINTRASIDHDCEIADFVHIAPGSTLCGGVTIGEESFVCAGATVIPSCSIGKKVTIGAGATLINNVQDNLSVAGVPARKILK